MGRVLALAMIACLAGCYQSPSLASCKYRCGGADNDSCPSGYSCSAGMCVAPGEGCDGDGGIIDAPPDDSGETIDSPAVCVDPTTFTWVKKPNLMTMGNLSQLLALDVNSDNKLDIVAIDSLDSIGVFLGNGDGTFGTRIASDAGGTPRRMIAGDFDHDTQRDDLLLVNGVSTATGFSKMTSLNNGSFAKMAYPLSGTVIDIANIGDVDNNGFEDAVVLDVDSVSPQLRVFGQSLATISMISSAATSNSATSITTGPLDTGAVIDAVVTVTDDNQGGFHLGNNTAPNWAFDPIDTETVNGTPVDAVIGQVTATGSPTVVFANTDANNVALRYAGTTAGVYLDAGSKSVGVGPGAVILANIAGDDLPDIVTANTSGSISVLVNRGAYTFDDTQNQPVGAAATDLISGDFDGDQRIDLAVALPSQSNIVILLNRCP